MRMLRARSKYLTSISSCRYRALGIMRRRLEDGSLWRGKERTTLRAMSAVHSVVWPGNVATESVGERRDRRRAQRATGVWWLSFCSFSRAVATRWPAGRLSSTAAAAIWTRAHQCSKPSCTLSLLPRITSPASPASLPPRTLSSAPAQLPPQPSAAGLSQILPRPAHAPSRSATRNQNRHRDRYL